MSLSVINLGYFLIGAFIFLCLKFIDRFEYFEKENLHMHRIARIWNFIFGMGCILVGINGIFSIIETFGAVQVIDYRHVLPTILLFVCAGIFLSDSFKKPSKNYLIAIGLGVLISAIGFLVSFIFNFLGPENILGRHVMAIGYLSLIPFFIAVIIGVVAGWLIHAYYLSPKHSEWNEPLWDQVKIWKVINNQYFLIGLCILIYFEIFFQWHSTSLVSLFFQLP